jgi:nucleoside-diphosphate-sugar epimerase
MARETGHIDTVIHAATAIPTKTRTSPADWAMNDRIRREGTQALTRYAVIVGAEQYIQQSITWVARPEDGSFYDERTPAHPDPLIQSALDGEEIALEAAEREGLRSAVLRFGYFYSADSEHTRTFGRGLLRRRLPIIGRGDALLSSIHVDDAASAVVQSAIVAAQGLWHVVDDESVTAGEFFSLFAEKLGAAPPRHVPVWLARLAAGRTAVELLTISSHTSNARFRQDTGWTPRYPTVADGLDQVIAAWRDEGRLDLGSSAATLRRAA